MIPKLLASGYNDNTLFPPSTLLPTFSKGFDKDTLHKRASMFEDICDTFERRPGYEYIHLVSVADGCTYGPNSRADFYNGEPVEIEIPHPEKGCTKIVVLDGGISKYHNTFLKSGGVYTEHRNKHSKNPPKSQGYIVAQAYNRPMKRGELIIGVNDDTWREDLDKLAKGIPLKFSIGFDATHDRCSICGHVAHTEDEHCDHIKLNPGQWDKDGNAVYMISDQGVYHDISRVRVPAERIAFSLKKVASGESAEFDQLSTNPEALRCLLKSAAAVKRYETVKKLAKIEKRIITEAKAGKLNKQLLTAFKKQASAETALDELHKFIDFAQEREVFGSLKQHKCVLAPRDFLKLVLPTQATDRNVKIIQAGLPGIFSDIWERPDLDAFCDDMCYHGEPCLDLRIIRRVGELEPSFSVDTDRFMNSILSDDLTNSTNVIIICRKSGDNDLSREYASYLADACSDLDEQESVLALVRALTQ